VKFFLDTAHVEEIKPYLDMGLVDGITTNPSLIASSGRHIVEVIREICALVPGPVSAEVTALDHKTMMREADILSKIAPNVVIKVPLTPEGIKTCRALSAQGIRVNVTLCFSGVQALLAAKAGATYVSPFLGRLDDIGYDGLQLISEIAQIYNQYPEIETQILAASVRGPLHVAQVASLGAHVATIPPKVMNQLFNHPLTDKGLDQFLKDWQKTGQSILG
jgi:transaldolase